MVLTTRLTPSATPGRSLAPAVAGGTGQVDVTVSATLAATGVLPIVGTASGTVSATVEATGGAPVGGVGQLSATVEATCAAVGVLGPRPPEPHTSPVVTLPDDLRRPHARVRSRWWDNAPLMDRSAWSRRRR